MAKAVQQLYEFTKRNPAYDINQLLNEPQYNNYFRLFIQRQLDMIKFNEGKVLIYLDNLFMKSSLSQKFYIKFFS